MINLIVQATIIQIVFFLAYIIFYKKHTFFQYRRLFILGTLIISVAQPMILAIIPAPSQIAYSVYLEPVVVIAFMDTIQEVHQKGSVGGVNALSLIYLIGIGITTLFLLMSLMKIYTLARSARFVKEDGVTYCITSSVQTPCSFYQYIFLTPHQFNTRQDIKHIIQHELVHVKRKHTLDVLLAHSFKIIFWFNPLIWWANAELKNIHEYQADQSVINSDRLSLQSYCKQMYDMIFCTHIDVVHHFSSPNIKNRIMQLKQKRTARYIKWTYLFSIPLLIALSVFIISCQEEKTSDLEQVETAEDYIKKVTTQPSSTSRYAEDAASYDGIDGEIFKVVEQMPRFPGCAEDEPDIKECATKKLLEYIYTNVKYPKTARTSGVQGTTVVRFVVDKNGNVKNPTLLRDIGGGFGEESLRVVQSLAYNNIQWEPGYQSGKSVNVQFNLPL